MPDVRIAPSARLSRVQFEDMVRAICPKCREGLKLRQREDTKEWVHDNLDANRVFSHSICFATHFRSSQFAPISDAGDPG